MKGPSIFEAVIVREVQVRGAVQKQNIESILCDIDPEPVQQYKFNAIKQIGRFRSILARTVIITEQYRNRADWYARKIVKPLQCDTFDIEKFKKAEECNTMH